MLILVLKCLSQDYHNLRATVFNRNVEELGKRTADLSESRSKFASSWGRAGAPAGYSPRDSGRLLRSRAGSSWRPFLMTCVLFFFFIQRPTPSFRSSWALPTPPC